MPGRKYIQSFFCWMVATVLLTVSMGTRSVPAEYVSSAPGIEQKDDSGTARENPAGQTTVSALSLDAVVISLFSYHFSQYLLPAPQLTIRFTDVVCSVFPARFSEPLFFFSYFQKVFEKQIAVNAP